MTKRIILSSSMAHCPSYWQNFAKEHASWADMTLTLAEYRAKEVSDHYRKGLVIDFEQDRLYTLFVLRYS